MDASPQLLTDVVFAEKRRGYDPEEVDNFLERVSAAVALLQEKLRDALDRAASADERVVEAQRAAQADVAAARAAGGGGESEMEETLKKTLVLAQRTADEAVKEAKEEAEKLLAEANAKAATILTNAEKKHDDVVTEAETKRTDLVSAAEAEAKRLTDETAGPLRSEIESLEAKLSGLRSDVHVLEEHLDAQRANIVRAVDRLMKIVEDPSELRSVATPAAAQAPAPATPAASAPAASTPPSAANAPASAKATGQTIAQATASVPKASPATTPQLQPRAVGATATTSVATPAAATPPPVVVRPIPTVPSAPSVKDLVNRRPGTVDPVAPAPASTSTAASAAQAAAAVPGPTPTPTRTENSSSVVDSLFAPEPAIDLVADGGPPTVQHTALDASPGFEDDSFLDELRKAVNDDTPLGPREVETDADAAMRAFFDQRDDEAEEARRPRFGRKR